MFLVTNLHIICKIAFISCTFALMITSVCPELQFSLSVSTKKTGSSSSSLGSITVLFS